MVKSLINHLILVISMLCYIILITYFISNVIVVGDTVYLLHFKYFILKVYTNFIFIKIHLDEPRESGFVWWWTQRNIIGLRF
jgi:hypothetical protein